MQTNNVMNVYKKKLSAFNIVCYFEHNIRVTLHNTKHV